MKRETVLGTDLAQALRSRGHVAPTKPDLGKRRSRTAGCGQRAGLVISISSAAGLVGGASASAYAASKFGLEGCMEALLARAPVQLSDSNQPPPRWVAGDDAIEATEQKARLLLAQVDAHRWLSTGLGRDDASVAA